MSRVRKQARFLIGVELKHGSFSFCFSFFLIAPSLCPCSSEEGGGRGVCEVDGAFREGTARGRRVAHENIHRNPRR